MKITNLAKSASIGGAILLLTGSAAMAAIATGNVHVRTGPSTAYRVVDTLRPGEQVAIIDRSGGWCAVQKAGPDGWVSCAYLSNSARTYRPEPRVSLSFGFSNQRWMRDDDRWDRRNRWDRRDRWDRNDRPNNSFGFSFSN